MKGRVPRPHAGVVSFWAKGSARNVHKLPASLICASYWCFVHPGPCRDPVLSYLREQYAGYLRLATRRAEALSTTSFNAMANAMADAVETQWI